MQNYPPPPPYGGQPFQPAPQPKQNFWKRQSRAGKVGIIAACIVLPLSLCICISAISAPSKSPAQISQVTVTTPAKTPVESLTKPTAVLTKKVAPTSVPPTATPVPPTAVPTQPPAPAPTSPPAQTGVNGNPWGYDFIPGNRITDPPGDFCGQYFACVTTFWKSTSGYVVECGNNEYSHSGGVSGACSRDGGVIETLYSH